MFDPTPPVQTWAFEVLGIESFLGHLVHHVGHPAAAVEELGQHVVLLLAFNLQKFLTLHLARGDLNQASSESIFEDRS